MKRVIIASALFLLGVTLFLFGGCAFVQNDFNTAYLPAAGIGLLFAAVSRVIE